MALYSPESSHLFLCNHEHSPIIGKQSGNNGQVSVFAWKAKM